MLEPSILHTYFDDKEAFLDQFIQSGKDHELFISSYIHGHFSVSAAHTLQVLSQINTTQDAIDYFNQHLTHSIQEAVNAGELIHKDAHDVLEMLDTLLT